MSTLKDLCNVPQSLLFEQAAYNVAVRAQRSYNKRMHALSSESDIFGMVKQARPKKKVRNSFSREEAGTCGQIICTKRFSGTRIHVTYKTNNNL